MPCYLVRSQTYSSPAPPPQLMYLQILSLCAPQMPSHTPSLHPTLGRFLSSPLPWVVAIGWNWLFLLRPTSPPSTPHRRVRAILGKDTAGPVNPQFKILECTLKAGMGPVLPACGVGAHRSSRPWVHSCPPSHCSHEVTPASLHPFHLPLPWLLPPALQSGVDSSVKLLCITFPFSPPASLDQPPSTYAHSLTCTVVDFKKIEQKDLHIFLPNFVLTVWFTYFQIVAFLFHPSEHQKPWVLCINLFF